MDQVIATFRNSVPKLLGLIALGIVMTLASVVTVLSARSASPYVLIAGYAGLVGFGFATLMFASWLLRPGPVIEVSTAGIRHGRWRKEFIGWDAIDDMLTQEVASHEMLILLLRPRPPSGRARKRSITMSGLDGSLSDLLDAIRTAHAYSFDQTSADRIGSRHV